MKFLKNGLVLHLCSFLVLIQAEDVCFEPKYCFDSTVIATTESQTGNECLKDCQQIENCGWWMLSKPFNKCVLLQDCPRSYEHFGYLTGQVSCPQTHCNIQGLCQGTSIGPETESNFSGCYQKCLDEAACYFFSFNTRTQTCLLFDACYSINDNERDYKSGHKGCKMQSSFTVLVAGGSNGTYGSYLSSVEVLNLSNENSTCSNLAPLPLAKVGAVGGLINDNSMLVCSGLDSANPEWNECYKIDQSSTQLIGRLRQSRRNAAAVVVNETLWVMGGSYQPYITGATEYFALDGSSTEGIGMPGALENHAVVKLNETTFLLTGGYYRNFNQPPQPNQIKEQTYLFDSLTSQWTSGPNMTIARYDHTASVITDEFTGEKFAVVIGGLGRSTTEFVDIQSFDEWKPGPDLARSGHCSVTWDEQNAVVVIGGYFNGSVSNSIHLLKLFNGTFTLTKMQQELQMARKDFVCYEIPESLTNCVEK